MKSLFDYINLNEISKFIVDENKDNGEFHKINISFAISILDNEFKISNTSLTFGGEILYQPNQKNNK